MAPRENDPNILKELLPNLEKKYALTNNRNQRTIMGFSMGAAGSIYWGATSLFSTTVSLDAEAAQLYRSQS